MENTKFILNFGCNFFETHTSHIPLSQRASAAVDRGVPLYTFDVRLSNTAANSSEWIPIRPGTDLAVILAMCKVIVDADLADDRFVNDWTTTNVTELKSHLADYTPAWAEGISGVPAETIRKLALAFANNRPSTVVTYRGAVAHHNGTECERAALMLDAIVGNIDVPGGRCKAVGASWKNSFKAPSGKKAMHLGDGGHHEVAFPNHHMSQRVLEGIASGEHGRPDIYLVYCYNPAYVNGDCKRNIEILKDESLIPFLVVSDVALSETGELADLLLPDATYLERWDWDNMVSYNMIPEYYIRQPLIEPLGEARNFPDVLAEVCTKIGKPPTFSTMEEFVRDACETTPDVKAAGGFDYMKKKGVLVPPDAQPSYRKHEKELDGAEIEKKLTSGDYAINDQGMVFEPAKCADKKSPGLKDYKAVVGQRVNGKYYVGFKQDSHHCRTSSLLCIKSDRLEDKGFPGLPTWMPIPEHQSLGSDQLILTSYKTANQTHSRTQNCKLLTEIYHDNPALINVKTARALGIKDGAEIEVSSPVGSIRIEAHVVEGIVPGVIAISNHCGHWAYGRYASGKIEEAVVDGTHAGTDPDTGRMWWKKHGQHPNWVIANTADPIGGQWCNMDTVVSVKAV